MADENIAQPNMFGRHRVVTAYRNITRDNVIEALAKAEVAQTLNFAQITTLHQYFLGNQPVLRREKEVRKEINNPVVENRAYEFVKWKTSYLIGNPISYSARSSAEFSGEGDENDRISTAVQKLNDECLLANKQVADMEMAQWAYECGIGYHLIAPTGNLDEQAFRVTSLDPQRTFVVYSNDAFHEPVFAATYTIKSSEKPVRLWTVYTAKKRFVISEGIVEQENANPLGMVPIIEYHANPEMMGCFEPAITLMDAINEVESNRVDGVAQFVQALMVFTNVDFNKTDLGEMLDMGAVKIYSTDGMPAKVELLTAQLDQTQTETLVNHMYKAALAICGMPQNMGGGASTSDTGAAVIMRDGWSSAESRAQETEMMFKRPETQFIRAAIKCMETADPSYSLSPKNVEIKFTRRNYENIQNKTQVLTMLLASEKVHPRTAFEVCGLFSDPEAVYDDAMAYIESNNGQTPVSDTGNPNGAGEPTPSTKA